jgi:putative ABC transport system permease protein
VWGTRALVSLAPMDLPRRETIAVDWRLAAVVVGVGALLGVLAGSLPAVWSTRAQLATLLRNAAVRGGGGGYGQLRRAMVVAQVALSLVLLSAGGLVVRSFERLLRVDPASRRPACSRSGCRSPGRATRRHADAGGARAAAPRARVDPRRHGRGRGVGAPPERRREPDDRPVPERAGQHGRQGARSPARRFLPDARGLLRDARHPRPRRPGVRADAAARRPRGGDRPDAGPAVLPDRQRGRGDAPLLDDTLLVVGVVEHARHHDVHQDGRPQVYLRDEDYTENALSFALRSDRSLPGLVPEVRAAIGGWTRSSPSRRSGRWTRS